MIWLAHSFATPFRSSYLLQMIGGRFAYCDERGSDAVPVATAAVVTALARMAATEDCTHAATTVEPQLPAVARTPVVVPALSDTAE